MEDIQNSITEEDRAIATNFLVRFATPKQILAGFSTEERIAGLNPEERVAGLNPEEIIKLYNPKEIIGCFDREELKRMLNDDE